MNKFKHTSLLSVAILITGCVTSSNNTQGYYENGVFKQLSNTKYINNTATSQTNNNEKLTFKNEIIIKSKNKNKKYLSEKYKLIPAKQYNDVMVFSAGNIESVLPICKEIYENEDVIFVQPSISHSIQKHAMAFDKDIIDVERLKTRPINNKTSRSGNTNTINNQTDMLDGQGSVNYYKYYDDVFRYDDESFWHIHNRGGFIAQAYYQGNFFDLLAVADVDANILPVIDAGITGKGIKLAVIDSAFELNHPDLRFTQSLNFFNHSHDISPNSTTDFHGTSVASVIAANRGNNYGIMGVAPDAYLYLYNGLFDIESDAVFTSTYIDIFNRAITDGIDIINCSWSSTTSPDEAMVDAINTFIRAGRNGKGGLVVFSSGNDSITSLHNEAALPEIISVGSIEADGSRSLYSNYGKDLDLVAPTNFVSLDLIGSDGFEEGEMGFVAGTSFAAPVVSGVIALLLEANPALTANQVKDILYSTTKKVGAGEFKTATVEYQYQYDIDSSTPYNAYYSKSLQTGYGLIDAQAAISKAKLYKNDTPINNTTTLAEYLATKLKSGWNYIGTDNAIYDLSLFNNVAIIWCFIDGKWQGYSANPEYAKSLRKQNLLLNHIPEKSGIMIYAI